ncbi:MAG: ATP-binding protein [Saprospiraceae bacterium]|nr:ATP-binding protein [Saprospiraceae bacterium]MDW8230151.1 ATP-binding protein [Saprospiraceae bacterium]
MIERILGLKIAAAAQKMPVVAITGPRQSGKSTLVRQVFPAHTYVNLEAISARRFAEEDPEGFLQGLGERVILDEIQRAPDLLSYIQVAVDEAKVPGQFILSGSQNLLLMESVSQSLAGRVAIFNLLPFSLEEIRSTAFALPDYEDYLLKGFYPRIYDLDLNPTEWLLDYIQTYVERDLRQLINVENLGAFRQFLEICAGRIGQLVNLSDMGSLIGVSHTTVQKWLSVLQTSFIVHLLRPYHRNYNKRIVKTPKLYFYDTGLACALLNLRSKDDLNRHFAKGALFENFIINELLKNHLNRHLYPGSYFWNAAGNHEIDLLLDKGGRLYPIEIKAARTMSAHFLASLRYFQALSGARPEDSFLVYGGDESQQRSIARVLSWRQLEAIPL